MTILIRTPTGEGCVLTLAEKTLVSAVIRMAVAHLGIKGRFVLRRLGGKLNSRHTIARAGGKDPAWVERQWKLEPVLKTAPRRKR